MKKRLAYSIIIFSAIIFCFIIHSCSKKMPSPTTNNSSNTIHEQQSTAGSLQNNRIQQEPVNLDYSIKRIAGVPGEAGFSGDGGSSKNALLNKPHSIFIHEGFVYVADTVNHAIRKFPEQGGVIETIAGGNGPGFSGDGGNAKKAKMLTPTDLFIYNDFVYVAEFGNQVIRRFNLKTGIIETIAGTPRKKGYSKNGTSVLKTSFNGVHSVFLKDDFIYVCDTFNHVVRRFKIDGTIETIAGIPKKRGYKNADDARKSLLSEPVATYVDDEFVYVAEYRNSSVRKFPKNGGQMETIAGGNGDGYSGDGGDARKSKLKNAHFVDVYNGYIYVSDMNNHAIRRFPKNRGNIETIAGGNSAGFKGENSNPLNAKLCMPPGIRVFKSYVYIAEYCNNTIRRFAIK